MVYFPQDVQTNFCRIMYSEIQKENKKQFIDVSYSNVYHSQKIL